MGRRWTPEEVRKHLTDLLGPVALPAAVALGAGLPACGPAIALYAAPEPQMEQCADGVDNDFDGAADCADSECFGVEGCGDTNAPVPPYATPPMPTIEDRDDSAMNPDLSPVDPDANMRPMYGAPPVAPPTPDEAVDVPPGPPTVPDAPVARPLYGISMEPSRQ